MNRIQSGIEPLDERTGGLKAGGVYVVAGAPGSGKLASALQFLATGLAAGERVALLAGVGPEPLFEQGRHLGFDLETPWRDGRLRLLGFQAEFEERLLSAADPVQAFDELSAAIGPHVARIAVDPGKPLWDTRAGTTLSHRFLAWAQAHPATLLATVASDLTDTQSPATEWVLQGVTGVFKIERLPSGLHNFWVRRISPPIDQSGPVTLELAPGRGFRAPGRFDRRLLLLKLAATVPEELRGWARGKYDAVEMNDPLRAVSRLQTGDEFGLVLVYLDRDNAEQAAEACRAIRPLTRAPIILATDDRLRATDRTRALDAGANDFLSDDFSLVELASRINRAWRASSGRPSLPPDDGDAAVVRQGLVESDAFARQVEERLADAGGLPFALIHARCADPRGDALGDTLLKHVRDAGDFVGTVLGGFAVVLQGARPRQAEGYLGRVREALGALPDGPLTIDVTVLSSATDAPAIRQIVRPAA